MVGGGLVIQGPGDGLRRRVEGVEVGVEAGRGVLFDDVEVLPVLLLPIGGEGDLNPVPVLLLAGGETQGVPVEAGAEVERVIKPIDCCLEL